MSLKGGYSAGKLVDRLSQLPKDDSNYMVTALATIVSASESDAESFLLEIFNVCFGFDFCFYFFIIF